MKTYIGLSGILFAAVAILHAVRVVEQWPVQVADWEIPAWVSWMGFLIPGILAIWAIRLAVFSSPVESRP
jgi:hypothetical protein